MTGWIAAFELRYQLATPVFRVAVAALFAAALAAMAIAGLPDEGTASRPQANAPAVLMKAHSTLTLLFMFATAAFASTAVLRDRESGFEPILRALPVGGKEMLTGRFLGMAAAAALAFAAVPAAMWIGSVLPLAEAGRVGAIRADALLAAYFAIALPNLLATSAIFFACAALTRSATGPFLGALLLLLLSTAAGALSAALPDHCGLIALAEPFGKLALEAATRHWSVARMDAEMPPLGGLLLWNRLLWSAAALLLLAFACRREPAPAAAPPPEAGEDEAPPRLLPLASSRFGRAAAWAQLRVRTALEVRQAVQGRVFLVLMLLAFLNAVPALWTVRTWGEAPAIPVTRLMIEALEDSFLFVAFLVAVHLAGELVWRDRERKIDGLIDAAPLPAWVHVAGKTAAVAFVLFATLAAGMLAAIAVQFVKGHMEIEPGRYLLWYVLPLTVDVLMFIAILAVAFQALAPNKYVGWGLLVLFFLAQAGITAFGWDHYLYFYDGKPDAPRSDMNGLGSFWIGLWVVRGYWIGLALLVLIASHLLWPLGADNSLRARLRRAKLSRGAAALLAGTAAATAATGAYAYYNTDILNRAETADAYERRIADDERLYGALEQQPQASIAAMQLHVALFPEEGRAVTRGNYTLENLNSAPLREIHVQFDDPHSRLTALQIEGASRLRHDRVHGYAIATLAAPMQPGERRRLSFETRRERRGFAARNPDLRLVANGTFLNNAEIAPTVGVRRRRTRPAAGDGARRRSPLGDSWTTTDIIVSTVAGQTPVAPGRRVSDEVRDGRRTVRFVSEVPTRPWFSIQSGRYLERRRTHRGVELSVYHHPAHDRNVERMLDAMAAALDRYSARFGPYPYGWARIVEFPAYSDRAQAFAGTIPISESMGFVAAPPDDGIDFVTYLVAHEMAHQWWGNQAFPADAPGYGLLTEGLAQYSALTLMRDVQGPEQARLILAYERERYLAGRASGPDVPLAAVADESFVQYHKSALAFAALTERLTSARIDRALGRYLVRHRMRSPYPLARDLIAELRREARSVEEQALITRLFER